MEEEIARPFTALLTERAQALRVGDPTDPRTQVGPLASKRRLERVVELTDEAVAQGAELHCGGPMPAPGSCGGVFYAPAVLSGVRPRMRAMREPLDAPVLAVASIDSVEEGWSS